MPEGSEAALRLEAEAAAAKQQQQQGRKRGKGADGGRQQPGQPAEQQQQQQQQQQAGQQQTEGAAAQQTAEPPAAAEAQQSAPAEAAAAGGMQPEEAAQARLRTQVVVPVSSAYGQLTPELLQRLFSVRGVQAQQLLLALVDSNGVVTRRWAAGDAASGRCGCWGCSRRALCTAEALRCLRRHSCAAAAHAPALLSCCSCFSCLPRSCLYNYIQAPLEGPGTANLDLLDD